MKVQQPTKVLALCLRTGHRCSASAINQLLFRLDVINLASEYVINIFIFTQQQFGLTFFKFRHKRQYLFVMRNLTNMLIRIFFFTFSMLSFDSAYSQTKCGIFTEYKNEIKIWAAATIDSLKKQGIDTILFYGVGVPNTGRVAYGKIIWTNKGITSKFEIQAKYIDNTFHLTNLKYVTNANYEPIQFYSDYRLDTVTTNPKELFWMSHDYLHFVYSTIHGTEVCFIAEDYLLRDSEHLRSRWITTLSESVSPNVLCR